MLMARTQACQLTFHTVTVPGSAGQPPVDGPISSTPFIQPTGLGLTTKVTGAGVMSIASGPVGRPSTQTPVSSASVDVCPCRSGFRRCLTKVQDSIDFSQGLLSLISYED